MRRVEFEDLVSCQIKKMMACAELVRPEQVTRHKEHNLLMRRRGVSRAV
jgi:hypothetical protein